MCDQLNPGPKKITWTSESVGYRLLANGKRSYCYRYRDGGGIQRCLFLGAGSTEKQAKAKLAEVTAARSKGEDIRVSNEPLIKFAERWLDEQTHLAPTTVDTYRWHLNTWIKPSAHLRKSISKVTHNDVSAFIAEMERHRRPNGQPLKGWTIRGAVSVLSGIFAEAVDQGLLAANPVSRVSKRKRERIDDETPKRILTRSEIDTLLAAAARRGLRWKALVGLFVFAGLRLGEALGLRWHDIDFEASLIHVRKQRDVKTGELRDVKTKAGRREIRLGSQHAQILAAWSLESRFSGSDDPVISTATGNTVSHRNALRALTEIALGCGINTNPEREDIPNLDCHALRHTYASAMIQATHGDVEKVRVWMGHKDSKVLLERYAHEFKQAREKRAEEIAAEVAAIDGAFGA